MTGVNPQALGERLLEMRKTWGDKGKPLTELADWMWKHGMDGIESCPSESIGSITAEVYLKELEGKAEQGDRYAKSMLDHIVHGVPLADDPSG